MTETVRAFIAFALPDPLVARIRAIQEAIQEQGLKLKWVRPENIHLTLKFLGDIPKTAIPQAEAAMAEAVSQAAPPALEVKGMGVFPALKRARVLWLGLSGDTPSLIALQKRLDQALAHQGFAPEKRPFKAHLTLARIKERPDIRKLGQVLADFSAVSAPAFTGDPLILFQSRLRPTGAEYRRLAQIAIHQSDTPIPS